MICDDGVADALQFVAVGMVGRMDEWLIFDGLPMDVEW